MDQDQADSKQDAIDAADAAAAKKQRSRQARDSMYWAKKHLARTELDLTYLAMITGTSDRKTAITKANAHVLCAIEALRPLKDEPPEQQF